MISVASSIDRRSCVFKATSLSLEFRDNIVRIVGRDLCIFEKHSRNSICFLVRIGILANLQLRMQGWLHEGPPFHPRLSLLLQQFET